MNNLQKVGGVSALIEAAAFVVGFGLFATVLADLNSEDLDPIQKVAFLADNQAIAFIVYLIIYVVFGVFLVTLSLALYDRLKSGSAAMVQTATAFGLIWAGLVLASGMLRINDLGVVADLYSTDPSQAATVWLALNAVEEALGGVIELPGGLWILLVSWAALRTGGLPRALNYLGMLVGVAGILSIFPAREALVAVFGLGLIVWFVWLGIVMLRGSQSARNAAASVR